VWAVAVCSVLGYGVDSLMCTDFEYFPVAWYLEWVFRLDQMGINVEVNYYLVYGCVGVILLGWDYWVIVIVLFVSDFWDDFPWVWDLVELVDFVFKIWILYVLSLDRDFCI
jgi:hypothetical protein